MKPKEITRIIGELDLHRLHKSLDEAGYGPIPVVIGDLFATGCYFIKVGKGDLGRKLCYSALRAYGVDEPLVQRVLSHVEDHPEGMAALLNPHVEVPSLLFS